MSGERRLQMFSQKTKLYLFDADGTLRRCTIEGQPCPNKPAEWELLPGVVERLAHIDWTTSAAGIVSNQAGVAPGFLPHADAAQMLEDTLAEATGTAATREWRSAWPILMCPHRPGTCDCRKPSPKMLLRAMGQALRSGLHLTNANEVLYVGDQVVDHLAAELAQMPFQWAHEFFGLEAPKDGDGIAWQGEVAYYGEEKRLGRVSFADGKPRVFAWGKDAWIELEEEQPEPVLRGVILSAARAGRPFWSKASTGPGPV